MVFLGDEAQVKARFGPFGDSANLDTRLVHVLCQYTIGSKIGLDAHDGTPRSRGSCVCLETVLVLCKIGAWLAPNLPKAHKSFWTHLMALLCVRLKWKLVSFCLEIVPILTQDRCTFYAEHSIGSEIMLDAPDGTPR
jgi:hypothetical protein